MYFNVFQQTVCHVCHFFKHAFTCFIKVLLLGWLKGFHGPPSLLPQCWSAGWERGGSPGNGAVHRGPGRAFCLQYCVRLWLGETSVGNGNGTKCLFQCKSLQVMVLQQYLAVPEWFDTFTHRRFYTKKLVHTDAFTHRRFYTQALLNKEAFTHREKHREAFTRRAADPFTHRDFYTHTDFYTQKLAHTERLLHTDAFSLRRFYTQTLLQTDAFTQTPSHPETFTHRSFYTQTILHTDAFTHRHFYRNTFTRRDFYTQVLLHTDRRFYAQRSFYPQTLLHKEAFTHRSFYTQTLLHTDAFTDRRCYTNTFTPRDFYTQKLLYTDNFTHKHFHTQRPDPWHRNFTAVFGDRTSFRAKGLRRTSTNRNFTSVFGDRTSFRAKGLRRQPGNRNFTSDQFLIVFWRSNFISCERVAPDALQIAILPGCSHSNTIYDLQLQKTIVLCTQPRHQATLAQPFQCDLQPRLRIELRTQEQPLLQNT